MGRSYAPLMLSIWQNDDFRLLSVEAQHLYVVVISQPSTNYCGICPLMPGRWSRLASNNTPTKTRRALAELERAKFVMVDNDTEEIWIKSFVKHNGVLAQRNVWKSAASSYEHIASSTIKQAFYLSLPEDRRKELTSPFPPPEPPTNGKGHIEGQALPQGLGQALPQGEAHAPTQGLGYVDVSSGFDLLPHLEPQPEPSSSSPPRTKPDDDDLPPWAWIEAERQADLPRRPGVDPIFDRSAWLPEAARRAYARWGAEVAEWSMFPNASPENIAALIAQRSDPDRYETAAEQGARMRLERGA